MNTLRNFSVLLCFFLITTISKAQPFFQWNDSIQVRIGGVYVNNPWAGGLNFIQASQVDMNMDGIKDLFMFDRSGNKIRTFINQGTAGSVDYKYDPYYETKFPFVQEWALLHDYDGDGKEDLMCYSKLAGGIDVYKNVSTTSLLFQLVYVQVRSKYWPPSPSSSNLYVSSVDIPAFSDIDNDTDMDVVTFAITGSYMEYHKNMSMELYGHNDSLKFQIGNHCWGYAAEAAMTNTYILHDTCFSNISAPEIAAPIAATREMERHAGSCQLCIDLDADGDKEYIVGDVSFKNLTMLTNGGTITDGSFTAKDTMFPMNNASTLPVDMTLFPCAYYVDVNYDGIKDLIVSPNAPNASENFNSVNYYKNNGTNNFPVFQFMQGNMLQDQMIDLGEGAYPVFFDYDSDGLKDLFVGNYGYYNSSGFQHQVAQFRNIGTATNPRYDLVTRDYMSLSTYGITNMIPTFGDMDADGDADMVIGGYDGKLHYFTNTAGVGATASFLITEANFKNSNGKAIDVGDFASPQIYDVDADGKNDLVIGAKSGKFAYYHHIGSGSTALLSMDSVTHFFGNVKVNMPGYSFGYSYPFMFKQGSVTKLLSGTDSGYLRYYSNIDGNLTGTFTLVDSTYMGIWQGTRTAPNAADINADGYIDLVVGNYEGGLSYYKGVSSITTTSSIEDDPGFNFELFPNPADQTVTIHIINGSKADYKVELYDMKGSLISSETIMNDLYFYNTGQLSQGIYLFKVTEQDENSGRASILTKRILVKH